MHFQQKEAARPNRYEIPQKFSLRMFPTELPLLTPNCSSNELIRIIITEKIRQEQYSSKINLKTLETLDR